MEDPVAVLTSFGGIFKREEGKERDSYVQITRTLAMSLLDPDHESDLEGIVSAIVSQNEARLFMDAVGVHLVSDVSTDGLSPRMRLPIACYKHIEGASLVVMTAVESFSDMELVKHEKELMRTYWRKWVPRYWTIWVPSPAGEIDLHALQPYIRSGSIDVWRYATSREQERVRRAATLKQFRILMAELHERGEVKFGMVTIYLKWHGDTEERLAGEDSHIRSAIESLPLFVSNVGRSVCRLGDYQQLQKAWSDQNIQRRLDALDDLNGLAVYPCLYVKSFIAGFG
ncbi:hypothetical protein K490DRAFT_53526 [Saccharata proteae CBS 121410]|uniref:Uncharacterized protein n=1 Tax=Saccharata proteae CBS 121410 TaxID=1314787 RepID=A0A9P4LZ06_9PEZI|nr:hypothetical protein K490DRAFT_53526 [Saccharata proteae CBS 121410]